MSTPGAQRTSAAAIEVLRALVPLVGALAQVTRTPELGRMMLDTIGCRATELLELYVRRVVESIVDTDPAAWAAASKLKVSLWEALTLPREALIGRMRDEDARRLSGNFDDAQHLLGRLLQARLLTPQQLQQVKALKERRNLMVHNNGVVDEPFVRMYPDAQLGERLDFQGHVLPAIVATFVSIKQIDALLVTRYPSLGITDDATDHSDLLERVTEALSTLQPSSQELDQAREVMAGFLALDLPFDPALLGGLPLPKPSFGTYWGFLQVGDVWCAKSLDGRVAAPFESEQDAILWVQAGRIDWDLHVVETVDDEWVTLQLQDGLTLRWPAGEVSLEGTP